ncbi:LacI family DNA-binding transcriptional regulator [Kitasatospora sp. NPDC101183]|uniref:LacI family DNA-binding transcriptional regulator n=1 Tax=Kitasatospora sp. NPDC101183 TaxID=3364100 RepID=UPI0038219DD1
MSRTERPGAGSAGPSTRPSARPTVEDVAARAGVSRGTVSRVVNGSPKVSAKAREAVESAVADLGYTPNQAARSLVTSRSDVIALVVPEGFERLRSEPYFADVIAGISDELASTDLQLLLTLVRTERERERLARYLTARRVDGLILASVRQGDPLPDQLERLGLPTVLGGRRSERETLSYVHGDNAGGARSAARHLAARGRTAVATITGPLDMEAAVARLAGYREALAEAGLTPEEALVAHGDFTEAGGYAAMRRLLAETPALDAVFCASDLTAVGALLALREAGRRVPEDVAVVGFDDSVIARSTEPPLTSVRQPTQSMGRLMARILIEEIAEPGRPRRQVTLPTELTVRASS